MNFGYVFVKKSKSYSRKFPGDWTNRFAVAVVVFFRKLFFKSQENSKKFGMEKKQFYWLFIGFFFNLFISFLLSYHSLPYFILSTSPCTHFPPLSFILPSSFLLAVFFLLLAWQILFAISCPWFCLLFPILLLILSFFVSPPLIIIIPSHFLTHTSSHLTLQFLQCPISLQLQFPLFILRPFRHSLAAIFPPWFRIISLQRSSHFISPIRSSLASLRPSLAILHVQNFCLRCPTRDSVSSFSNPYSQPVVPSSFSFFPGFPFKFAPSLWHVLHSEFSAR